VDGVWPGGIRRIRKEGRRRNTQLTTIANNSNAMGSKRKDTLKKRCDEVTTGVQHLEAII
jgi:hypothetical protein